MNKKLLYNWNVYNQELNQEERYCHNCGKKVIFTDSLKRRQNANGKNIYNFAIYKCPNNHTFNKKIEMFKTFSQLENNDWLFQQKENQLEELYLSNFRETEIEKIEICLTRFEVKKRIDQFLSQQIKDLSRNEIVKWIEKGLIQVNQSQVKRSQILKENDLILINLK